MIFLFSSVLTCTEHTRTQPQRNMYTRTYLHIHIHKHSLSGTGCLLLWRSCSRSGSHRFDFESDYIYASTISDDDDNGNYEEPDTHLYEEPDSHLYADAGDYEEPVPVAQQVGKVAPLAKTNAVPAAGDSIKRKVSIMSCIYIPRHSFEHERSCLCEHEMMRDIAKCAAMYRQTINCYQNLQGLVHFSRLLFVLNLNWGIFKC